MSIYYNELADFMDPEVFFPDQSGTLLSCAVSSTENANPRSAPGPKSGNATFGGRFAAAHPDTEPVYSRQEPVCSVNGLLPGMSQTRGFFPPDRFGMGVARIGNVSRNLPLFDRPAMVSAFPPDQNWHQGLAGPGMSSGPWPSDRAVTSTRTVDDPGGSCQLAPSGKITSKGDTSESNSRQASTEPAAPGKRLYVPGWKAKELDKVFQRKAYITRVERAVLASALQMTKEEVRVWFQNKRTNIKRRCLLDGVKNSAHNMMSSRAVSRASGDQQQSASFLWQRFGGVNQKYTLFCERDVISSTVAKSPVGALQDMLVQIERNPSVRFFRSVDNYCQSRLSKPDEPPATTSHTVPGN